MDARTQTSLQTAYQLLKAGQKQDALALLAPLVKANPNLAEAWYLLGFAVSEPEKRMYAFQQVLRVNPNHEAARKQVAKLVAEKYATPEPQKTVEAAPRPAAVPPPVTPTQKTPAKKKKPSPLVLWAGIGAILLCLVFMAIGIWAASTGVIANLFTPPIAAPATSVAALPAAATLPPATPTLALSPTPAFVPVFRGTACPFDLPLGTRVRCGVVSVPQDRTKNFTDLIDIPVVIYQSVKPNTEVLIYLQGGPGSESLDWSLALFDDYVAPVLDEYDMVFFDPRGTGRSSPRLECPELNTVFVEAYFEARSESEAYGLFNEAWSKCRDRFARDGIDPGAFNTTQSAADVHDIAVALGYEKVNLIGISYGTRLALTIMRDFPEIVRSAILDSVVPMESKMFNRRATDVQYALDKVFDDCASSPRCNSAYPDLRNTFNSLIERFDRDPARVKVYDPSSGFVLDVNVSGVDMVSAMVWGLHTSELVPVVPKAIYDTQKGDYTFLSFSLGIPGGMYNSMGLATYFSTVCHEQIFATTPQEFETDLRGVPIIRKFSLSTVFGDPNRPFEMCKAWGALPFDPRNSQPVVTDIPTLILSGEYDPTTPVTTGQIVSDDLPNDYFYVIPGMGHGASVGNACSFKIVMGFLKDPTQEPDHTCLEQESTFDFFLPFDGSEPLQMVPLTEPSAQLKTIIPAGWEKGLPYNVYYRQAYLFDPTTVQFESVRASKAYVLEFLTQSFASNGFEETPRKVDTYSANGLNWTIYNSKYNGEPVLLALAEIPQQRTLAVIMVVSAPERDAFYKYLLLPILQALEPLG